MWRIAVQPDSAKTSPYKTGAMETLLVVGVYWLVFAVIYRTDT